MANKSSALREKLLVPPDVARWDGTQQRVVLVEDYEINRKEFIFKELFSELKVDQTIQATKMTRRVAATTQNK